MRQVIGLSEDKKTIVLNRFDGDLGLDEYAASDDEVSAIFLDVESTGLNTSKDKIIDLGYVLFTYSKGSGKILRVLKEFSSLCDPKEPLSEIVKRITGYTDAQLSGKSINWEEVEADFDKAKVIIAHNASFDRAFIDRYCEKSKDKIWACSMSLIPWRDKGHGSRSLEYLAKDHGFFFDGHTALADAKASLYLLNLKDSETGLSYFKELLKNARVQKKWVYARGSSFDFKDALRERGYIWDSKERVWKICVPANTFTEEEFLEKNPSAGNAESSLILLKDNFKK